MTCVFICQDKRALEQQQLSYRLQISALQSKLDETKHCYNDHTRDPMQDLRNALDTAQQNLCSKEQEVCKKCQNLQFLIYVLVCTNDVKLSPGIHSAWPTGQRAEGFKYQRS